MTGFAHRKVNLGDLTFDVYEAHRAQPSAGAFAVDCDQAQSSAHDGEPTDPSAPSAIVLLHGFPQTSLCWAAIWRPLVDAGYRVIAIDQRGYSPGARPHDVRAYTLDKLSQDVLDLAAALGLDRFHLVGHDWGAAVGWASAAKHPDRVKSLTALSVPHLAAYSQALSNDPDAQQKASYIEVFRTEGKAEQLLLADNARRLRENFGTAIPEDHVQSYVETFSEPAALTAALAWYRAMDSSLSAMPPVQVPTSYVWSEGDSFIGRAGAQACGDYASGDYDFIVLDEVSHWIPEEAPGAVVETVLDRVARTG